MVAAVAQTASPLLERANGGVERYETIQYGAFMAAKDQPQSRTKRGDHQVVGHPRSLGRPGDPAVPRSGPAFPQQLRRLSIAANCDRFITDCPGARSALRDWITPVNAAGRDRLGPRAGSPAPGEPRTDAAVSQQDARSPSP